jgi:hypothetical protein
MDFQTLKTIAGFAGVEAVNLGGARVALLECRAIAALQVRGGVAVATYVNQAGRPVLRETLAGQSVPEAFDQLIKRF